MLALLGTLKRALKQSVEHEHAAQQGQGATIPTDPKPVPMVVFRGKLTPIGTKIPCEIKMDDSSAQPESALRCRTCGDWRSKACAEGGEYVVGENGRTSRTPIWSQPTTVDTQDQPPALEPVDGDLLPPVGSRVFILHGRDDDAHACIVTGYYVWGSEHPRLNRVFVRLVYEGTNTPNARMLCDCYATKDNALAARASETSTTQKATT